MIIKKVFIKGFGKIIDLDISFNDKINFVFGSNESGKSTIQMFILSALYGLKGGRTSKDGVLPPLKRYKPWDNSSYGGVLEYELDNGNTYTIERNFDNNTVKVIDKNFNDITSEFEKNKNKEYSFAKQQLLINKDCFERTSFIKQMETRFGQDSAQELQNRLINISQTGFEDVSYKKAEEALKEALKNYVGTDKTKTRPLDIINQRIEELKVLKNDLTSKEEKAKTILNELKEDTDKKEVLLREIEKLSAFCEIGKKKELLNKSKMNYEELAQTFEALSENEAEIEKVLFQIREAEKIYDEILHNDFALSEGIIEKVNLLIGKFENESEQISLIKDLKNTGLDGKISDIETKLKKLKTNNEISIYLKKKKTKKFGIWATILFLFSALTMVFAISGKDNQMLFTVFSALSFVLVSTASFVLFKYINISKALKKEVYDELESLKERETYAENMVDFAQKIFLINKGVLVKKIEALKTSNEKLIQRAQIISGEKIIEVDYLKDTCEKMKQNNNQLEQETMKIIQKLAKDNTLINEEDFNKEFFKEPKDITNNIDRENELIKKLENTKDIFNEVLLKIREKETILKSMDYKDDLLQEIKEEISYLKQEKKELESTGKSINVALNVLSEAEDELKNSYVPLLNKKMNSILKKIIKKGYNELKVADNLCLKAMNSKTNKICNVLSLSHGTIDQMYLILRLASSKIIGEAGEKIPMLLDEVFSQFDDERIKSTLKVLEEKSKENQIVIFSCKKRELETARNLFGHECNFVEL